MPDEEKPERRSMVGAPPTARRPVRGGGGSTPAAPAPASSTRPSRSAKKPKKEEVEEEEELSGSEKVESDAGDLEESADEEPTGSSTPNRRRKRKRGGGHLTDYHLKKKKILARKAQRDAEKAEKEDDKEEEPEPEEKEPEAPLRRPPSLKDYTPFQLMLDHILRKITFKDPEEYFALPVTQFMAPDYHTIIKNPMDFSTIRQKIEDKKYGSMADMKADVELIVANAMTYNQPNTVFYLAAQRLTAIIKYYFGEQYLRYIFHTLPMANKVPLEKVGLTPLAPVLNRVKNHRRAALVDDMRADDILKKVDAKVRGKLTTRKPKAKLAFLESKEGTTVLNVLTEDSGVEKEKRIVTLGDVVGSLDEGTPGMIQLGEHRLHSQTSLSYLNYGPFSSFAPQYDSTWATMNKRDTDLLLRTYGDRQNLSDVFSMRAFVADAGEHMIKVVDDLLDTLTDGEHSRAMKELKEVDAEDEELRKLADQQELENTPLLELLDDVSTLANVGIDVDFVDDLRKQILAPVPVPVEQPMIPEEPQPQQMFMQHMDLQQHLNHTGQAIQDLAHIQRQRLAQDPSITLTNAAGPSIQEHKLAEQIQQQLVQQVSQHATPGDFVSDAALHGAMGVEMEEDMDLVNEFLRFN